MHSGWRGSATRSNVRRWRLRGGKIDQEIEGRGWIGRSVRCTGEGEHVFVKNNVLRHDDMTGLKIETPVPFVVTRITFFFR